MAPEEVRRAVKDAVREVLQEQRSEFWISQPQHYDDHKFIAEARCTFARARNAGMMVTISTVIGAILTIIWIGFRVVIRGD